MRNAIECIAASAAVGVAVFDLGAMFLLKFIGVW